MLVLVSDVIMNQREWRRLRETNKELIDFTYYNKTREIQKSLQYNSNPEAVVIHYLRDTEEQRKYNDEHYELWGFNEDGTFEYGKYVIFVTKEEHIEIHRCSEETRKKISYSSKNMWLDTSYREKMIRILNSPDNKAHNSECIKKLWQTSSYRDKQIRSHTDEFKKLKSQISASKWADAQYRDRVTSAIKEKWSDASFREKVLKIYSSKEYRQKLSNASKKMWQNDTYRAKVVESLKRSWLNEEYRNKVIQAVKASWTAEKRAIHSEKFTGKNNPMYGLKGKDHPAFGNILSDETRKKMSESWTDDRRHTQSERVSREGNPNYGQHLSEKHRECISNSLKEYFKTHPNPMNGRRHSDTTKKRMSAVWTDERRRKRKELIEHRKFVYNKYKDLGGNLRWNEFTSLLTKVENTSQSLNEEATLSLLLKHNV